MLYPELKQLAEQAGFTISHAKINGIYRYFLRDADGDLVDDGRSMSESEAVAYLTGKEIRQLAEQQGLSWECERITDQDGTPLSFWWLTVRVGRAPVGLPGGQDDVETLNYLRANSKIFAVIGGWRKSEVSHERKKDNGGFPSLDSQGNNETHHLGAVPVESGIQDRLAGGGP